MCAAAHTPKNTQTCTHTHTYTHRVRDKERKGGGGGVSPIFQVRTLAGSGVRCLVLHLGVCDHTKWLRFCYPGNWLALACAFLNGCTPFPTKGISSREMLSGMSTKLPEAAAALKVKGWHGGLCLPKSQHSESRGRRVAVSWKPAWA